MSFLLPQALWGLPAVALPLIIHLISRINTKVVDFSTLHFLRMMEHESIRRLRWHQWLIIILRTLLILVLVLLLARPVLRGYFQGWIGDNASTLSVAVIDDSFSMNGQAPGLSAAYYAGDSWRAGPSLASLYEILADQSSRGRVAVLRASDARVIYEGSIADLPEVEEIARLCQPGYYQDNLAAVLDTLSSPPFQDAARLVANREFFFISDFQTHQQQALRTLGSDTTFWNDWHFLFLHATPLENNTAVTGAEVESPIPLVGELMDVSVTLQNTGHTPRKKIPVQVVLNEVRSGQLVVDLNPGEKKTVTFQIAPSEPGHQQGYAEIDRDDRPGDNRFYFHTYIPTRVRVLLVEPPELNPSFSQLALRSLTAATPNIQLHVVSPVDPAWSPHDTEVVILNSLNAIPNLLLRQLDEFLGAGGILIVIPSHSTDASPAWSALQEQFDLPPRELVPQVFESSITLDHKTLETSFLGNVFQREMELADLPRLSRIYATDPQGVDEVILWSEVNTPLLIRSPYRNGNIFLFALPFHLLWSDMPLKGSFIPMWHHLIYWRPTSSVLTNVRVGDAPTLAINPRQATQSMALVAPNGISSLLIPNIRTRTVTLRGLLRPGIYSLAYPEQREPGASSSRDQETRFRVNIPGPELTSRSLSRSALTSMFTAGRALVYDEDLSIEEWVRQARFGRELWRPLLYLFIVLLIMEMILGNAYRSSRKPLDDTSGSTHSGPDRL